jgi:hypothetical protein
MPNSFPSVEEVGHHLLFWRGLDVVSCPGAMNGKAGAQAQVSWPSPQYRPMGRLGQSASWPLRRIGKVGRRPLFSVAGIHAVERKLGGPASSPGQSTPARPVLCSAGANGAGDGMRGATPHREGSRRDGALQTAQHKGVLADRHCSSNLSRSHPGWTATLSTRARRSSSSRRAASA